MEVPQYGTLLLRAASFPLVVAFAEGEFFASSTPTEWPSFVDEILDRSDIRSDPSDGSVRDGATLVLTMNVFTMDGWRVHAARGRHGRRVWHRDADGVYSEVEAPGFSTLGGSSCKASIGRISIAADPNVEVGDETRGLCPGYQCLCTEVLIGCAGGRSTGSRAGSRSSSMLRATCGVRWMSPAWARVKTIWWTVGGVTPK